MTTDKNPRQGSPTRPENSSRAYKAYIVASLAAVYALTFYLVADPLAAEQAVATEPAAQAGPSPTARPAALARPKPAATKRASNNRPVRLRTRSS